jgi:MYXO-CTERM domain-containing protein
MNFKNLATGAAFALGFACLGSPAHADVILTYTGNDFTQFTAPYTGTDKVTASITLANPLGDNLNLAPVTPLAFSLSDGVQTLTNDTPSLDTSFEFSTNAMGVIDGWFVRLIDTSGGPPNIFTATESGAVMDFAAAISFTATGSNGNDPGTWTSTSVAVPAPPLSNLAGLGVLGLAFLWRRRRQILGLAQ